MEHSHNHEFWTALDQLVEYSTLVIDRPKGTPHPHFPDLLYEVDYGYLEDTASPDRGGIDVWVGSAEERRVNAVICTVDLRKRDSELKILLGCTEAETAHIYQVHNQTGSMKGLLVERGADNR